jgi:heme-degrading monooxygenase HmoA
MIIRVVKMTFMADQTERFIEIFNTSQRDIQSFQGCIDVKLLRSITDVNQFFTLSRWDEEKSLEAYRTSELFRKTWASVKPLFSEKAEAWSLCEQFSALT